MIDEKGDRGHNLTLNLRVQVTLVLYRALALAGALAVGILLTQAALREAGFALLSGAPEVEAAGRDYFNARIWGAPAYLAKLAFLGWFLGRERSGTVLTITIVTNVSNVGFNYLFIVHRGLAAFGAGLGTMLADYLGLTVAVGFFLASRRGVRWRWAAVLDRKRLGEMFTFNRDILIRTVLLISAFAVFTDFGARIGTEALAANAILMHLVTLAAYMIDGAAFACESLAGVLLGQGNREALRRLFRLSHLSGELFGLGFLAVIFAAPAFWFHLFTSHEDVVALTLIYGWWMIPVLLFGSPAYIYDGLFLGLTAGRTLRNAMLISMVGVFLPAALVAVTLRNNHVLWFALFLFQVARATTLWWASRRLLDPREA